MVAEAEHAVATARRDGGAQARHEGGSLSVIEDMKESAIENGVELLPERRQLQRVPHKEARLEAAVLKDSPIMLQKIIADKLSDKVQIMMVPGDGKFFFANDVLRGATQTVVAAPRPQDPNQ